MQIVRGSNFYMRCTRDVRATVTVSTSGQCFTPHTQTSGLLTCSESGNPPAVHTRSMPQVRDGTRMSD